MATGWPSGHPMLRQNSRSTPVAEVKSRVILRNEGSRLIFHILSRGTRFFADAQNDTVAPDALHVEVDHLARVGLDELLARRHGRAHQHVECLVRLDAVVDGDLQ
jgi:hypothetical protein